MIDLSVTKQSTLRTDRWFETSKKPTKFLDKVRRRAKKWQLPDNRKEAAIADSFGLKTLQKRSKRKSWLRIKQEKEINRIGHAYSIG